MKKNIIAILSATVFTAFISSSIAQVSEEKVSETEVSGVTNSAWELVWSDEFDSKSIDMTKWSFETDCWGGGNEERQCYTDRKKNARVKSGNLEIIARRERYTGHALPASQRKTRKQAKLAATKPYTSARLRTIGKGDWRYGRVEIRAKLPGGQGVWPAIWMLPSDSHYGNWAASGEIDIMEAVNLGVECAECDGGYENNILGTLHYGDVWPNNAETSNHTPIENLLDEFHTYTIEWSAGEVKWFIDGEHYATQTHEGWYSAGEKAQGRPFAPFDQRFHLILNIAVGGRLPEERNLGGVSKEGFPKTMFIDWVRVYQCKADPLNGVACQTEV